MHRTREAAWALPFDASDERLPKTVRQGREKHKRAGRIPDGLLEPPGALTDQTPPRARRVSFPASRRALPEARATAHERRSG